ncbi:MAG: YggS family pyridoxal phosphate-dependent enzyme [Gammaproteobacteria bacterium]|nr:MAG: YggS family pyridoxal phosphate-dependent enzyme [Gammaproteobacteria bacterium]
MIEENLKQIYSAIASACKATNRCPDSVRLLAVSKRHGADKIQKAYDCGQRDFGENYLNEALDKQAALAHLAICWHFIGHVQSNKTRKIAEHFDWVHAVDSLKVAKRLSDQRPEGRPPINICLQINIDGEDSKAGLAPDEAALITLAHDIAGLPNVALRGLMCIPAPKADKAEEIATFTRMRNLQQALNASGLSLDTLSMGMSDDLETAITCGATIVRVGTAIFGVRPA